LIKCNEGSYGNIVKAMCLTWLSTISVIYPILVYFFRQSQDKTNNMPQVTDEFCHMVSSAMLL
jgi:hypothetical protein